MKRGGLSPHFKQGEKQEKCVLLGNIRLTPMVTSGYFRLTRTTLGVCKKLNNAGEKGTF